MPTELDRRMDAKLAALIAPGGPLATTSVTVDGVALPFIATAPATLPAYFAQQAAEHADKTLLVAGDERLRYAEVHAAAERVARALIAGHGVGRGTRVGIAMRNSPSWIVLYMGIVMAGGVAVLLNGWWQAGEFEAALADVEPALVFADPPRAARLGEIANGARIVSVTDTLPLAEALGALIEAGGGDAPLPQVDPLDAATILFTSGSTGRSKGAVSDHRAVVQGTFSFLAQALVMLGIATDDGQAPTLQPATLLNLPLFHVTAEIAVLLQSFAMGRKLVLMPKWDAEEAMRLIQAEQVTYFVGVPLMSFEMLNHPRRAQYDLSTVSDFAAGGAPRPEEHVRRLNEEMGGGAPLIGYGLTETNAIGVGNWRGNYLAKPTSAGRESKPLVEVGIFDGAGRHLPQGERGEIGIRSVCNFKHYDNHPDATVRAFTADRYFLTGDIGYLDEDRYLFIVDRKKDIIIRGGENISCQEVEAALYEDPAVAEAAVFGLPDARFGEVPAAVVHLVPGVAETPDRLRANLAARIAAFKVPQRIWLTEAPLPRLGTEKIDKVRLRAAYAEVAAAEAVAG